MNSYMQDAATDSFKSIVGGVPLGGEKKLQ